MYRLYVALDDAFTNVHQIVETYAHRVDADHGLARHHRGAEPTTTPSRPARRSAAAPSPPTPDSLRKKSPRTELTSPAAGAALGPRATSSCAGGPWSSTLRDALSARVAGTAATSEAYAYRVQVAAAPDAGRAATDADFQSPVEDVVVDGALCRPTAPVRLSRSAR